MSEYYVFDGECDGKDIIHPINILFNKDIVGAEIGVCAGVLTAGTAYNDCVVVAESRFVESQTVGHCVADVQLPVCRA